MDKKRGLLNISVSIFSKLLILAFTLITRRLIIHCVGNEINGISSLYTSIIGFLTVAELGVGTAIAFSMYAPIVNGESEKVNALYRLYRKLYYIVAGVMLVGGFIVMPFLPMLAKGYGEVDVNLYFTFALALVGVVTTYLYSAKTSLINAHKNNFITSAIHCFGIVLQSVMQIVVLVLWESFELYLVATIVGALVQWLVTTVVARKMHSDVLRAEKIPLEDGVKLDVVKKIKAMFMHKIGNAMVNTVDSIVISAFVGVVILGKYSNYVVISTSLISIISLIFTPLTAIIGQMFVKCNGDKMRKSYELFHRVNFLVAFLFFGGYYAIIDDLIFVMFGEGLELASVVVKCITINYFVQFMRRSTLLFRDASGLFYNDRWKPLIEGVANLALSVLFVMILPDDYNVAGVIVATIITNLFICHIVEPYILYKNAFLSTPRKHFITNYLMIFLFSAYVFLFDFIRVDASSEWGSLLINGCISVGIWIAVLCVYLCLDRDLRGRLLNILRKRGLH